MCEVDDVFSRSSNSRSLSQDNVGFSELENDLFWGVSFDGHFLPPSWPILLTFDVGQFSGGRSAARCKGFEMVCCCFALRFEV